MAEKPEAITHEAVRDPSDEEWLISIFDVDGQQPDQEARSKHRIQKAPAKFREYEKDKKYFDPRVVSLGPYHGKDLLKPMETYKITAAKQFFDRLTNVTEGREGIYKKFKESTGKLKECYDAEVVVNKSDDVFARMMFLDGCFVLHFIEMIRRGIIMSEKSKDLIPLIIRDMFLIENQLPFKVLDALINLRWGTSCKGKEKIWKFKEKILEFIELEILKPMGMSHWFYPHPSFTWRREHDKPLHLLDILRTILLDSEGSKKNNCRPRNFGSATELKEIGIRFENRNVESLWGIRFEENLLFPKLLLPTMYINDTTISLLLNLTAFEMCSDIHSGCGVTSYIHFLGSLINHGEDVKMLRSKGILNHSLGSDDEVARLFNMWPADVMSNLELYSDISMRIRWYRDRRVKIYIATLVEKYFVAASLILVLTAIQTYFAAFPRR